MPTNPYAINRRYDVNNTYFDCIQTEHQAYWLGLLWADGNISRTAQRCAGPNRLRLVQLWSRRALLQTFLDDLESTIPIKRVDKAGHAPTAAIDINSRPLCMALQHLGFGLKSERTSIPIAESALLKHFLRGYFDGDGCLSLYEQHVRHATIYKQEWSLTGNETFLRNVRSTYEPLIGIESHTKLKRYRRTSQAVTLRYGKKSDVLRLCQYMYDDATLYLEEKYAQYRRLLLRPNMQTCTL